MVCREQRGATVTQNSGRVRWGRGLAAGRVVARAGGPRSGPVAARGLTRASVRGAGRGVARASTRGCGLVTVLGLVLAVGLAGPAGARAAATGICESSAHPALAARLSRGILAALRGRSSAVGLRVVDRRTGVTCSLHPHWHFASASVVKVTILSALLRKLQQEHKTLTSEQRALATEMITESDNQAASLLWDQTGRQPCNASSTWPRCGRPSWAPAASGA